MRAIVFDRYGEPDVMSLREVPVPEPQAGEVLIRVGCAGVNPSDSKARLEDAARAHRLARSPAHACQRQRSNGPGSRSRYR
jgi:NADPH:quinone reductase-like Zn-dependent oxidoreductase